MHIDYGTFQNTVILSMPDANDHTSYYNLFFHMYQHFAVSRGLKTHHGVE